MREQSHLIPYAIAFVILHSIFVIIVIPYWVLVPQCALGLSSSSCPQVSASSIVPRQLHENHVTDDMVPTQRTRNLKAIRRSSIDPIRIAWGVFSNKKDDLDFRSVLRETYLTSHPYICALSTGNEVPRSCRIAYMFVLEEDVPHPTNKTTTAATVAATTTQNEDDVIRFATTGTGTTLLSSWLQYASHLETTHIDYVAKVDMQALLVPDRFLEFTADTLYHTPRMKRVVGGIPLDRYACGGMKDWKCRQMTGKTYFSDELYFVSTDVARIAPDDIDHVNPLSFANWVQGLSIPILQVAIRPLDILWEMGPDDPGLYRERWEYLKSKKFDPEEMTSHSRPIPPPRYSGTSLMDELY